MHEHQEQVYAKKLSKQCAIEKHQEQLGRDMKLQNQATSENPGPLSYRKTSHDLTMHCDNFP